MSGWLRDVELRPTLVLTAACVLLAAAAMVAWFWRPASNLTPAVVAADDGGKADSGSTLTEQSFQLPALDQYVEMVDRPLFNQERRPVENAPEPKVTQPGTSNPKALRLNLTSVIIAPGRKLAIFRDLSKNKSIRVAEGEVVKGWRLSQIQGDKVILERDGKSHELPLRVPKPEVAKAAKKGQKNKSRRKAPARGGPAVRQDNK